ncbi:hypothetical protein [uncultured Shewanella sp.]|uniref:hypothetical protein n=1 Tax=uncultured Shewanella sp. TaxID=173975 RepID=UPI002616654D|nr:hypothetical protein [uncultured Shewanella sp.]
MPAIITTSAVNKNISLTSLNEMTELNTQSNDKMSDSLSSKLSANSALKQITQQTTSTTNRDLGKLHTPLFDYSLGQMITTLFNAVSLPITATAGLAWLFTREAGESDAAYNNQDSVPFKAKGPYVRPNDNAAQGLSEHIIRALTGTADAIKVIGNMVGGGVCLGETLLSRAVYFCMGHDTSKANRMGQVAFPKNPAKIDQAVSDLQLLQYTLNNEMKSGKDMWGEFGINQALTGEQYTPYSQQNLPEGYRIAKTDEIPSSLIKDYNYDSGILKTNPSIAVGVGVFIEESTGTIKLAFRGIGEDPSTAKGSITGSLYTDSFMQSTLDIVERFERNVHYKNELIKYENSQAKKSGNIDADIQQTWHIELLGHSLGGEGVEYAGAMTGLKTTAYNSAGLSALTRAEIGSDRINAANITNVNTQGDWLSQQMIRSSFVPKAQIGGTQYQFAEDTRRTNGDAHFVEAMIDGLKKY